MTPLCFIDTETTGVHQDRQVWEIAMIRRDDQGQREQAFFVDVDLSNADPFGLKIGGFYDRHPKGIQLATGHFPTMVIHGDRASSGSKSWVVPAEPVTRARAALHVAEWTHGAHLVGAVPNFDAETLAPLLREHGLLPAWHYHLIDVEALAVGYLAGRRRTWSAVNVGTKPEPTPLPWKSDDLSLACGVEPATEEERHTALGDARWAMRIYDAIILATP